MEDLSSNNEVLKQLEHGPTVEMGGLLAAEGQEITTSTGVYTIWLDTELLYVGISWKRPSDTPNKNAKGVFGRLRTYYDARRTDDFTRDLCDRFVTPYLTADELALLARGELDPDLSERNRRFARERLTIRAIDCPGEQARTVEKLIRESGLPEAGQPLFNRKRYRRQQAEVAA